MTESIERSKLIIHNETSLTDDTVLKHIVIPILEAGEDRPGILTMGDRFKICVQANPRSRTLNITEKYVPLDLVRRTQKEISED